MQLIVFDLDGTLIDSSGGINSSLREAVRHVAPELAPVDIGNLIGPPIAQLLRAAYPAMPDTIRQKVTAEYRVRYDTKGCLQSRPYEGVMETLSALHQKNCRMGMITNKPKAPTDLTLQALNLTGFFDWVLSVDSISPCFGSKSEMLGRILTESGVAAADTCVVGDSRDDAQAAHAYGCPFIAVAYGYGGIWQEADVKKAALLHSMKDFLSVVEDL